MNSLRNATIRPEIQLNFDNFLSVYNILCQYSPESSVEQCLQFLDSNAAELIEDENTFCNLPHSLIQCLVRRETFRVVEWKKCKAFMKWYQKNVCDSQTFDIIEFLKPLRWDQVSVTDFKQHIRQLNLINSHQYLDFIAFHENRQPRSEPLSLSLHFLPPRIGSPKSAFSTLNPSTSTACVPPTNHVITQTLTNFLSSDPHELVETHMDCLEENNANGSNEHNESDAELVANLKRNAWHSKRTEKQLTVNVVNGERVFVCKICNNWSSKSFYFACSHVSTVHFNEKPFVCEHCGKCYAQKHHLSIHVESVHINKRVHECFLCGKSYTTKQSLRNHRKRVHEGAEVCFCTHCGVRYKKQQYLKIHINKVHSNQPTTRK